MKYIYSFLFLLLAVTTTQAQNCDCSENFNFMIQHIKKNYVGFNDKVVKHNQQQFDHLTDSLQKEAKNTSPNKCISLCKKWLDFFKDRHMTMTFNAGLPKDSILYFFSKEEKTSWTENNFKSYLNNHKNSIDDIEGIWNHESNNFKYGIIRDSLIHDEFIGFVIKADGVFWTPQQIKFKLKKTNQTYSFKYFLARDHSNYPAKISLQKDTIDLKELGRFYKNAPPEYKFQLATNSPKFEKLDKKTSVLTIPSFDIALRQETDSLMIKNASALENTEHLIIDLRNNRGGAIGAFEKILPYLYTNPILTEGAEVLATDDNIKDGFEEIPTDIPEDVQNTLKKDLVKLKAHRGEMYLLYPVDTIRYNTILKKPSRVSVLMNKESSSSAELFALQAKQSTKVKLYGINSAGSINYVERVETQMPCKFFTLIYPPTRLLRANKDKANEGIKPDVEISMDVKDWVKFVKDYKL
ncbi:S41 family peptidase [Pedobacter borealis]|uniref:S41 family peptidase n=1 Tax=Pedobacter borealis TaxID=475254 RepID=UPI00049305B7|nr:S41 family peptidase [Pedobacter borealis]